MFHLKEEAKALQGQLVEWRRYLHRHPEVSQEVPETAAYVAGQLKDMGLEVRTGVGGHGVVAVLKGDRPGKTIGIRADMDALNIKEETGLPFSSKKEGMMHACGHDGHMAMALGTAQLLSQHKNELAGAVKFIFQPAEEGPGGAEPMIKDGALENPKVDAIIGLHLGVIWEELSPGQVGVCYGSMMASLDRIDVKIKGKGGHGAMPHVTVDAISIASQVVTTLQTIVSREVKPVQPAVVTIGKFHGGTAYNVITDLVELEGTVRCLTPELRQNLAKRIEEIIKGVTTAMRGDYEYKYTFGYPPLFNNPDFTKEFSMVAAEVVGAENVRELTEPTMGGEDMAYLLQEVPGTFFFLSSNNPEKGIVHPHHNPKFDIDEDVLWIGTALFSAMAVKWLGKRAAV